MPLPSLGLKRYSRPPREEVFDRIISSNLLPLNDPDTRTLLHNSTGSRSSADISFASSSLARSCSWEVLQDLGFDHLPILMRPNLLFLSAASNAILKPGGLLRCKVRLVKDARLSLPLTEVMKIARITSPLLDAPRQSLPKPRLRHGRRLALLFYPNQTRNLYTLFFALSLALPPRLLTSLTVLLSGNRLLSTPLTCDVTSLFLSQRPCVAEPEAAFLSYLVPRALRSLTRLFALLSLSLNFLRLPPTFPPPLPLAQTKLPIPC